jgi:uncharacterized protein with von Willebrand factor type A (vWA) domain
MAWGKKRYGGGFGYRRPSQGVFDYSYLTQRNINVDDMVMNADALDALYFSSTYNSTTRMGSLLRKQVEFSTPGEKRMGVENKLGDIFTGLFDWDASIKADPPDPEWAARLEALHQMPEYDEIRKQTIGYRSLSAAGSVKVWDLLQRHQWHEENGGSQQGQQGEGETPGGSQQGAKERADEYLKERLSALSQDIEDAKELGSEDEQSNGYSPDGEGAARYLYDPALANVLHAQENFREISKIAGRMEVVASRLRADKLEPMGPPIDIVTGNDVSAVIPSELLMLADDDMEDYFWMKYLERGLMQYDRADIMQHGRGPIVMCIDVSGSMNGQKAQHAAAFAVALSKDALKQRRRAYVIPFSSHPFETIDIKPGGAAMHRLMTSVTRTGGGTEFQTTLEQAEGLIKDRDKDADILFLTDGAADMTEEWAQLFKARKEQAGFKLIGIRFADVDEGSWPEPMVPLMDAHLNVSRGKVGNIEWYGKIAATAGNR